MAGRFTIRPAGGVQGDPWFHLGTIEVTTTVFVAILAAISMFIWAAAPATILHLALFPALIRSGQLWRLATWPFANGASLSTVIDIVVFWYFGSQIEDLLRRRRFAWYLGVIVIVPALVASAIGIGLGSQTLVAGIGVLSLAMFVAFAVEYPGAKLFFGIPAWVLAAVYVAIKYLQLIGSRDGTSLVLFTVGLAIVSMGLRSFGLASNFPSLPALPLLRRLAEGRGSSKSKTAGSGRTRIGRPTSTRKSIAIRSRSSGSKPLSDRRNTVVQGPWSDKALTQLEVDVLLDKIASNGIDSLTADERRGLDEASRRLRERRDT